MLRTLKNALVLLCCTAALQTASAQSLEKDYTPLKSVGMIPEELTLKTRKKVEADLKKISNKGDRADTLKNYVYHSNYALDLHLRAGNVLLNDEMGAYMNRVAAELLKSEPALAKEIKVQIVKVPEMNAMCLAKGYLFIYVGLIAQAENEAQLAGVLAHEIGHYIKQHGYESYAKLKTLNTNYAKKTFEDRLLEMYSFSKEHESEADTYGFNLYEKSGYKTSEFVNMLDRFKYASLPFENKRFDTTFFNDAYYKIPAVYFLEKTKAFEYNEASDDQYSTHPNLAKRKENIEALAEEAGSSAGKNEFIVSESDFSRFRDMCRFEECRLYLTERSYYSSIISAYTLLQKYPENVYLHKVITKSLYAMTLYKNGDLFYVKEGYKQAPLPDFTKNRSNAQQLNFMLDRLPQKEMAVLALKYAWAQHKKFPSEPVFLSLSDSLFRMLALRFGSGSADYYGTAPESAVTAADYYRYAFVEWQKNDEEFRQHFQKYVPAASSGNGIALKPFTLPVKADKKAKTVTPAAAKLSITKVVVMDPSYLKINNKLDETSVYRLSDRRKEDLVTFIKINARHYKIDIDMIDPDNFVSQDIDKFNDFSVINDWYNERMEGGYEQKCPLFNSDEIPALVQKYGTKYFLWTGVVTVIMNAKKDMVQNFAYTYYSSVLFDIETGKVVAAQNLSAEAKDNNIRINDYVEDTFQEIAEGGSSGK